MIPLRLEIEGFLSWRQSTAVDLAGLEACAIVGENGAGKTSLIEAMSWALYGAGRGHGPDDFVNAGTDRCRVSFEFELAGSHYKVERQRDMGGRGKSYLGLSVELDEWAPCGGDRIEETQRAIEELLGMDFETWATTSWIGQGQADRFTELKPVERKRLLAEVLELGRYDVWADQARGLGRELAGRLDSLRGRISDLRQQTADEATVRADLGKAIAGQRERQQELGRRRHALDLARSALSRLREQQAQLDPMKQELATIQAGRRADRTRASSELLDLQERMRRGKLERENKVEQISRLVWTRSPELLEQDAEDVERRLAEMSEKALELQELDKTERERMSTAAEKSRRAELDLPVVRNRLGTVVRSTGRCFACEQELPPDVREQLVAKLEEERGKLERESAEAMGDAKAASERVSGLADDLRRLESEAHSLRGKAMQLRQEAETVRQGEKRRTELEADVGQIDEALADLEHRASNAQAMLEAASLPYPREEQLSKELLARAGLEGEVTAAAGDVGRAEEAVTACETDLHVIAREVGSLSQLVKTIDKSLGLLAEAEALLSDMTDTKRRTDLFAEACGPNGIPALLIEIAIPELEAEANEILVGLEGRLRVTISSLRALKTGGLRETLDVQVADDESDRPLEQLSGGERQCVDLALRIGLSRILARRKNREIRMLVMDECFTALDVAHRQRTIELIHRLREQFGVIFLVTHLSELAEAFPSRIQVTRGPAGSELRLEGGA